MKTCTTASCFATYTLPHVLFVDDFEERQRIVLVCCLAWNISLFPDAHQREQHIAMVWNQGVDDNQEPPPDGMEHGWKSEMRMLIAQKHELFPRLISNIPKADLLQRQPHNILSVQTNDGGEEIPLITHPRLEGLPHILPVLRRMYEDTGKQVETLQDAARTPGLLKKLVTPDIATMYDSQRADLVGYYRMFTVWRDGIPDPSFKREIGHWLDVLNEIEAHSKTVLGIITQALNA